MLKFAPSPTGDMHINTLRVAILNYLAAQQRNEPFLVRMEDIDKEDIVEGKDTEIMQILEKFALKHDAVYHQSEHLHMHQTLAIRLLEEEKAFLCTCKEADEHCNADCIDANRENLATRKETKTPFVIRLKKPDHDIISHDLLKGDIIAAPDEVGNVVILGEESKPTYDFACACDDMLDDITLVIRTEEHLADTPRQIHIKQQLGYKQKSHYLHLPLILNENEEKIDKAPNIPSLKYLFEEGFIPDAIINYLILLSSAKVPKEIFTLPEAIGWFNLEEIPLSAVRFDIDKLRSINREHLKMMDDKKLSTLFGFADADIGKLAKLYLEELPTVNELKSKIKPIFAPKSFENRWAEQMKILQKILWDAPMIDSYDAFISYLIQESGLKDEALFKPLRLLLTGTEYGPEISEIYPYIKPYLLEVIS